MARTFDEKTIDLKIMVRFCVILWVLGLSPCVLAGSTRQTRENIFLEKNASVKTLTVSDTDAAIIVKPGTGLWDFQDINPLNYVDSSVYTLDHEFTLINENNESVIISAIRGSDPRVGYNLPFLNGPLPITLHPHGFITIKLHYRLLPLVPGKINICEMIFIEHQVQPAATLQFSGRIQNVVTFDPPMLDFGVLNPGQVVSKILTVTYDPQMYPGRLPLSPEKLPLLVSDKSFITVKQTAINYTKITRIPGVSATTYANKEFQRLLNTLPPINNVVVYSVTVKSPNSVGQFHGYISIIPIVDTNGYDILSHESIAIQGRVRTNN